MHSLTLLPITILTALTLFVASAFSAPQFQPRPPPDACYRRNDSIAACPYGGTCFPNQAYTALCLVHTMPPRCVAISHPIHYYACSRRVRMALHARAVGHAIGSSAQKHPTGHKGRSVVHHIRHASSEPCRRLALQTMGRMRRLLLKENVVLATSALTIRDGRWQDPLCQSKKTHRDCVYRSSRRALETSGTNVETSSSAWQIRSARAN
jgi:hypothetical protein